MPMSQKVLKDLGAIFLQHLVKSFDHVTMLNDVDDKLS
jgi:hypothetical protein